MRIIFCFKVAVVCLALALGLQAQTRITSVEPLNGKPGDTITAIGEGVDQAISTELYLTDGAKDYRCQVVEQNAKMVKFKIPADMQKGRFALLVQNKQGQWLQQPVKVTVE